MWMTPEETTVHLWENFRLRRSPRTLANMRTGGNGPPYRRVGSNTVLYARDEVAEWAAAQLNRPFASTAEENAA